ncbi:MAG: cobyrinate a,c-diamide synthase [Gammaproteobacteria bacterium]|nr:cobyrinate a,c-diamide synthase [Gammaproteobacteria bacterium]MYJ51940.1 cobyrinate a,c-diamide synthase [Gammaproteobacteria bacterium]
MQGFLISATRRSSGKTTVAVGLCRALKNRGLEPAPFKKGPDYIDPMWLGLSAGAPCVNLDFNTMTEREIARRFARHCKGRKMAVLEGNMGLFDGMDPAGRDSNAELARQLGLPVILVVDCRGMTRGIAPLLLGYAAFDPEINLAGVVLNNVGGSRHESKLRAAVREYTDLPVVGAMARQAHLTIPERHLGLATSGEDDNADRHVEAIASAVESALDIETLIRIANRHRIRLASAGREGVPSGAEGIRLGIARDRAFSFYYPDDIADMEDAGIDLVGFSPVDDAGLPDVDALLIGGGFPEMHAARLQTNASMREAVLDFCRSGRPVYAECGGLMYLGRSLGWRGRSYRMAGYFQFDTVMQDRPVGRGYVQLAPMPGHPWHDGRAADGEMSGAPVRAHEFHHSSVQGMEGDIDYAWRIVRGHGIDGRHDGFVRQGVLAGFSHFRNTRSYPWIEHFTRYIRQRPVCH